MPEHNKKWHHSLQLEKDRVQQQRPSAANKQKTKYAICSNMHGPEDYHVCEVSQTKKGKYQDIAYMCN